MALPGLEVINELMQQTGVGAPPDRNRRVWLCANCGEPRETNEGQCSHCGGETFALLESAVCDDGAHVQQPGHSGEITAPTVAAWFVGLVTLGHAVVSLLLLTFAVPFFGIATVASWPPARRWYESQTGYTLTTGAAVLVYVTFMIIGYVALFI